MATAVNALPLGRTFSCGSYSDYALDTSTKKVASVFMAHKTGTIDRIGVWFDIKTGTPPTYDWRLEGVGSTLRPSGTLAATNTNLTAAPTTIGWNEQTLTASKAVTAGEMYAVVIAYASGTVNGSNNMYAARYINNTVFTQMPSAMYSSDGSTWNIDLGVPVISARYSDGEYTPYTAPLVAISYNDFGSSSNPDEYAIKFVAPAAIPICGARIRCQLYNSGGHFAVGLYNSGGTNLTSGDVTATYATDIINEGDRYDYTINFAPVTLTAGDTYYLSFYPTTTTTGRLAYLTWANTDAAASAIGYPTVGVTRVNAGSWSADSATVPNIVPLFNSWPSASSGGGAATLINGGLVG